MHIAIVSLGSRGDVQPYVALGQGLREAGHAVRILSHDNYKALVESQGLEFWAVRGDAQAVAEGEAMRAALEKGNFVAITRETAKQAHRAAVHWAADGMAACRDVDLIVAGVGGLFLAIALGEKLNIPFLPAYLFPFTPTSAFPSVLFPPYRPQLKVVNRASHHLVQQAMWQGFRSADGLMRSSVLDLPAAPFFGPFAAERLLRAPILYGFSPVVIPKPDDWGAMVHVTGYWFLDEEPNWSPPPALEAFLQAGPPPVAIGFGSMTNRQPQETTDLVLQALARNGQRGVLLSGWGGLRGAELPASVFMLDAVPHHWLFSRVAAVVHHGGAGTTAAGLRAGIPSVLVPYFGDQSFWAARVRALGVGPAAVPRRKLTAEGLAGAIQQAVSDETMRQRAGKIGALIRAEDGVGRAAAVIGAYAAATASL